MPFSVISVAREWDLPENYTNKYMKDRLGQLAGEGGEGLNAGVLKTAVAQVTGSSNLPLSANHT